MHEIQQTGIDMEGQYGQTYEFKPLPERNPGKSKKEIKSIQEYMKENIDALREIDYEFMDF